MTNRWGADGWRRGVHQSGDNLANRGFGAEYSQGPALEDTDCSAEMSTSSSSKKLQNSSTKNLKTDALRIASVQTKQNIESITSVTAITDIPSGTCSEDINAEELAEETSTVCQNLMIRVSDEGRLSPVGRGARWLLQGRLADDCHSCNVMLRRGDACNTVLLQAVKAVRSGEELRIWFSEQLLAALAVPFLTPLNIQGEKKYVCHLCGHHFETPNPLKIHLALDCDRLGRSHLWKRLTRHLSIKQDNNNSAGEQHRPVSAPVPLPSAISCGTSTFEFKLDLVTKEDKKSLTNEPITHQSTITARLQAPNIVTSSSAPGSENPSTLPQQKRAPRPVSEPLSVQGSAFKPYWNKYQNSPHADTSKTKYDSIRTSPMNILSSLRPPLISQPHFVFHPSANISAVNLSANKSSSVSGLLSPNSRLLPGVSYKPNVLPSSFQQQPQQRTETSGSEFHHAAEMETLVSNLGRSKQGHLCIYCGKIYSRKYGLKIHIRTHTGYKPLKCKYCLRPFGDPSNLNKHVRLHAEGDTPYKCDLCGKILVRRRDLERHVKSRHTHPRTEQRQEADKT